jgi:hypothetical protein
MVVALPAVLLAGRIGLADRPHVVILGPALDHLAVVRMRGELAMLGIDVDVVVRARDEDNLPAVARRMGATAVLRVETSPPAIVLWVDPTLATVPSPSAAEVRVTGPAEERDPGLLALRAVEVLRARLLKVPLPPAPEAGAAAEPAPPIADAGFTGALGEGVVPPAPPATAVTEPRASNPPRPGGDAVPTRATRPVGLEVAPAMLVSPGGVPPAFQVRLGAEWDPIPRLGLEVLAFLPVTAGTVSAPEGSIDLRVMNLGGDLRVVLTDPAAEFSIALGAGASAVMLAMTGKAGDPWAGQTGTRWGVAPFAAATLGYRVHPRFAIRLDALAALVRPEQGLRIAGRSVAMFGEPAVIPSLGVEVRP